jgi:uncharacterized protein
MQEPFAPPAAVWTPVSPRLRSARRLVLTLVAGPILLAGAILLVGTAGAGWVVGPWLGAVVLAAGGIGYAWGWRMIDRAYRAVQYAERLDDLAVRRGVFVRTLVLVPYGRMQFVDVEAGPLRRRYGIATVQLHTAAAATDATIPGLLAADAAALRDRLAARSGERSAGL